MVGLWMAVVVSFLLSAEKSLADVNQNWLTGVVEAIKNDYGDSLCLAVNIPQNQDADSVNQVLHNDPADRVKETVLQGRVYKGSRVVAAEDLSHVLQNIQPFIKSSQGNVLIIYSPKANEKGIASKISDITHNWGDYVFVFSKVTGGSDTSFKHLEISGLGLGNIFRCYEPGEESFQCSSCSSGGDVSPSCVANTDLSSQEEGGDAEISTGDIGTELIPGGLGDGGLPTAQGKGGRIRKCKGRDERQCRRKGAGKRRKGGKRRNKGLKRGRGKGGKGRRGNKSLKGGRGKGGKRRRNKGAKRGRSRKGGKRKSKGRRRGFQDDLLLFNFK